MAPEAPAKDSDRYYEEIPVGETFELKDQRTITEADIVNFAGISNDYHPAVASEPYAQEKFGGRIAHGHLIATVLESIIGDLNPRAFSYGQDKVRYPKPTYIGDTLSGRREVLRKEERDDEYGMVVYQYEAMNQDGDTVCAFQHLVLVERKPDDED